VEAVNRPNLAYVPALDGIRAVAILFVFLYHMGNLRGGWVGVDIFFTLSGYLITLILLNEYEARGSISIGQFFFRRVCRLLPAVVLLICVALAISFYSDDHFDDVKMDAIASLFYVEDFRRAFWPLNVTGLAPLWSLSVEEKFYLIWPFFLILSLSFLGRKRSLYAVLSLIGLVIAWRLAVLFESTAPYYRIYFLFDTRIDELLIGSALALWSYRPGKITLGPISRLWPLVVIFFTVVLVAVDPVANWVGVSGYPLIGAVTACLIIIVTSKETTFLSRVLTLAPLVALGRISYGFYLWHYLVIRQLSLGGFLHIRVIAFAITLVVAILSYHFIEQPILRFGRRALSADARPMESAALNSPATQ
jgi:peptidoglycan/LPS O-acetylase OafA/YrhL